MKVHFEDIVCKKKSHLQLHTLKTQVTYSGTVYSKLTQNGEKKTHSIIIITSVEHTHTSLCYPPPTTSLPSSLKDARSYSARGTAPQEGKEGRKDGHIKRERQGRGS